MSSKLESDLHHTNETRDKIPNLKEFVKYLNQTINLFDSHVSNEDFEKKDSDIYKLFVALFNMYIDLDPKCDIADNNRSSNKNIRTSTIDETDVNSIIEQHINIKRNRAKNNLKWENNRHKFRSDEIAQEIYKKSLLDLCIPEDDSPILFTNNNKFQHRPNKKESISTPIKTNTDTNMLDIYTDHDEINVTNKSRDKLQCKIRNKKYHTTNITNILHIDTPQSNDQGDVKRKYLATKHPQYEKTDDIDSKIDMLKKMLHK
jgi:hypothetical protein